MPRRAYIIGPARARRERAAGRQVGGIHAHPEQGAGHRLGGVEQVVERAAQVRPGDGGERRVVVQ